MFCKIVFEYGCKIRLLFSVCRELLEVEHEDEKLAFKLHALVTNANYNMRKAVMLLFINRKLAATVEVRSYLDTGFSNFWQIMSDLADENHVQHAPVTLVIYHFQQDSIDSNWSVFLIKERKP